MKTKQMVDQFFAQGNRQMPVLIADAAAEWIAKVEVHPSASPEAKAALIAKIREALPKVKATHAESFTMACNDIKAVMNA